MDDFGKILENWDLLNEKKRKNTKSSKKKNAPSKDIFDDDFQKRENPMNIWLRQYGVIDKDKEKNDSENRKKFENRSVLRKMKPDATIDLHGLTKDEAYIRLRRFVDECCRMNLKKILIIHGKGNHSKEKPVLDLLVKSFIENDSRLGESGKANQEEGGSGATWVLIKNKKQI